MKLNKLFEDVFMDIDWSLYDDETAELPGLEKKIYRTVNNAAAKWRPKTREDLVEAIKTELENGNTDLNCIDTSEITDMSWLFISDPLLVFYYRAYPLPNEMWSVKINDYENIDISDWDVSNVENMDGMFLGCTNFNSDLSKWDVSKTKTMNCMFSGCTNFNQDLSSWDVRNVEGMNYMFRDCKAFSYDLSKWNDKISDKVRLGHPKGVFKGCTKLIEKKLVPKFC